MVKGAPFMERRIGLVAIRVPLLHARDPARFALQSQALHRNPTRVDILPDIDTDHQRITPFGVCVGL